MLNNKYAYYTLKADLRGLVELELLDSELFVSYQSVLYIRLNECAMKCVE